MKYIIYIILFLLGCSAEERTSYKTKEDSEDLIEKSIRREIVFKPEVIEKLENNKIDNDMLPFPKELLQEEIKLTKRCSEVKIVEWRPTKNQKELTSKSDEVIKAIDDICNNIIFRFDSVLKLNEIDPGNFMQEISLMPGDIHNHGKDYRSLNDIQYRFRNRLHQNEAKYIWGYTDKETKHIYLFNKVLIEENKINPFFKEVFSHELYHALSMFYDVYEHYTEEINAREFTKKIEKETKEL